MEDFFGKFGFLVIEIMIGSMIISLFFAFVMGEIKENRVFDSFLSESIDSEINAKYKVSSIEDIEFIVENGILEIGDSFNWENFVIAYDHENNSLIDHVYVSGEVNTNIAGEYEVVYTLSFQSQTIVKKGIYYVS